MPLDLGAGFRSSSRVALEPLTVPETTVEDLRSEQLLVALEALREALFTMPAPVVNVSEPDLSAIVTAVTSLKGPASPEDIARAVVNEISPGGEPGMDTVLSKLTESLERLDFRLKGIGATTGGGGSPFMGSLDISSRADREIGRVTVDNFPASQPVSGTVSVDNFPATQKVQLDQLVSNFVTPSIAQKATSGKFFLADTGMLPTTVTNNNAAITFTNPSTSGKNAFIVAITIESDVAAVWAKFVRSPTLNLPVTVKTSYNAINLSSTAPYTSSMVVKGDAMASEMDGVTTLASRVTSNVAVKVDLPPFTVTPGTTIGLTANLGGTGIGSFAVYYFEEPV